MIFAPFDILSDGDSAKPIHRKIKRDSYTELCDEHFTSDLTSIQRCTDAGKGFVARCEERVGMVFFSQNDMWYEWFDKPDGAGTSYWWTEDSFIGGVEDGQCYFVPYTHVLDMREWGSYEELIVPLTSVKVILDKKSLKGKSTLTSSKQTIRASHPPTSIMKSSGSTNKTGGKAPKSVKIEQTPADALPRGRGNASEGVTTGGTCSSVDDEEDEGDAKEESKRVNPRVEGPSDHSRALSGLLSASSRRGAHTSQSEEALEKDKTRLFNGYWSGMKHAMNWRIEWGNETLIENNFYMTPHSTKLDLGKSIENLEYFYSQDAMLRHIEENPCLTYEWKAVWPMLEKAGWSKVNGNSSSKKVQYVYQRPSGAKLQLGLTRFYSKLALCTYINRFPYALQDNTRFAETLQRHGWIKLNGSKFRNTEANVTMAMNDVRKEMWENPALLFSPSFASKAIGEQNILKAVTLSESMACAVEAEPDTPSPVKKGTSKMGESSSSSVFSSSSSSLPAAATGQSLPDFVRLNPSIDTENDKAKFTAMLQAAGWRLFPSNFMKAWYEHELITVAPWKDVDKRPELGVDAFWGVEDIFFFMKKHGVDKPKHKVQPFPLRLDFRKSEWTLDRRIQDIASEYSWYTNGQQLLNMLLSAGWLKMAKPNGWPSSNGTIQFFSEARSNGENGTTEDCILIPSWNRDVVTPHTYADHMINEDYFCDESELARYLTANGNRKKEGGRSRSRSTPRDVFVPCSSTGVASTEASISSRSVGNTGKQKSGGTKAVSKKAQKVSNSTMTKSGGRKIKPQPQQRQDEDSEGSSLGGEPDSPEATVSYALRYHSKYGGSAFPSVWQTLKNDLSWQSVFLSDGATNVMVPPWSVGNIHNRKFMASSDTILNRDYFLDSEDLMKYIQKYGTEMTMTEVTPQKELGRGAKRQRKEHKNDKTFAGKKAVKRVEQKGRNKGQQKNKRADGPVLINTEGVKTDVLEDDELAAMYSSDDENGEDYNAMDEDEFEAEEMPKEYEEEERKAIEGGVPEVQDTFRPDVVAIHAAATGGQGNGEPWLDVKNFNEVVKFLMVRKTWFWTTMVRHGIDHSIRHRLPEFRSRKTVSDSQLRGYIEGKDYFVGDDAMETFLHGQLRAHGLHVNRLSWDAQQHELGRFVSKPLTLLAPDSVKPKEDEGLNLHYAPDNAAAQDSHGAFDALLESVPQHEARSPVASE